MVDRRATPGRASGVEIEASRLAMMRRVKQMTIEQRIDLLQSLVRDAAWARGARRGEVTGPPVDLRAVLQSLHDYKVDFVC